LTFESLAAKVNEPMDARWNNPCDYTQTKGIFAVVTRDVARREP
jgi:hypothetical protein